MDNLAELAVSAFESKLVIYEKQEYLLELCGLEYNILPLVEKTIYMYIHAYSEDMMPLSDVSQLHDFITDGKVER